LWVSDKEIVFETVVVVEGDIEEAREFYLVGVEVQKENYGASEVRRGS
jgi:hypothetical protein